MSFLFWHRNPYDVQGTERVFMKKVRENMFFHFRNCKEYQLILERKGFDEEKIKQLTSLEAVPFLPTLYLKHHKMDSVPENKMITRATSSGTSGNKSDIGYDLTSLWRALGMAVNIGRKHKLFSLRPCHYIVLGYQHRGFLWGSPKIEEKAVAKTAYAFTALAPALSRKYALRYENGEYVLNLEAIREAIIKYSKGRTPVRIIGFPFHAKDIVYRLKEYKGYLQTVGLICSEQEHKVLASELVKAGVVRVTHGGNMSVTLSGEAHDGEYALRRYCRVVEIE